MIFLQTKYLIASGFLGFACWPFIFIKSNRVKQDRIFINHERIHLRQQIELLVIPFFIWYAIEYLINLIIYNDFKRAYYQVSFEKEAYSYEKDMQYLKNRKPFQFLKQIKV